MVDATIYPIGLYILFGVLALVCEYVDSAMGGGYGTILVPILLAFEIEGALLIPAVLLTEIWSGLGSAILHHHVGNADFHVKSKRKKSLEAGEEKEGFKKNTRTKESTVKSIVTSNFSISEDLKIVLILSFLGILGGVGAAFLAISINALFVKIYIGVLVIIIGVVVTLKMKWKFAWWKISAIGLLAAFNKGLSGGGYGPLISSGQMIVDRNPRQAVASTSLSEATVCIASLVIYFVANGTRLTPAFGYLVLALLVGSLASIIPAVMTVKYLNIRRLQPIIGIVTILLGIFTLLRIFVF
ncbi:MAG: sulfite exporter TauE/SafE family protein [Candidatus Heimdallarchaeota archaeon]|nr:sulfite exporter TauE/SafE family protein [Candidatus Heimdallarchaeota archaeon]MCK4253479.1 sulfite exporter TauE/SafE family protein [Candidatus Heimdallarchaeota archaeon]